MRSRPCLLGGVLFLVTLGRAFPLAKMVLPEDRSDPEQVFQDGKKYLAEGHLAEATVAFTRLKQMDPLKPRAYFFLGVTLAEAGHLNAAAA